MMDGRSYVMSGSLSDFTFREVLDVVALSRQHTVVELHEPDGSSIASINLKAGHLVTEPSTTDDAKDALQRAIHADTSCVFHVYRLDETSHYRDSGRIADVLAGIASTPPPPQPPPAVPRTEETRPVPAPVSQTSKHKTRAAVSPSARTPSVTDAQPTRGLSLAVASPKGGVGKTTITLNLGISLARRGLRVIVIDADVNGDIMSLVDARGQSESGTYDVLTAPGGLESALRGTAVPGLRVLPSMGSELSDSVLAMTDHTDQWRALLAQALTSAEVVLVDCPAGMTHTALQVLRAASHVLGVFQAETVASRSFEMFERVLATLSGADETQMAGVVVNMLRDDEASSAARDRLAASALADSILGDPIAHGRVFDEAAAAGTPVQMFDCPESSSVAAIFDRLAADLAGRLSLTPRQLGAGTSFLQ